jgi:hypothetical protein
MNAVKMKSSRYEIQLSPDSEQTFNEETPIPSVMPPVILLQGPTSKTNREKATLYP